MSIGYQKGQYWVPDEVYAKFAQRESYKKLLRATRKAGFTFHSEYSYNARRYTAEIITLEQFKGSAQWYIIKHNNAYDPNPMAAVCTAIRQSGRMTPLVSALCLEIEVELLADAYKIAVARQAEQARLETKLNLVLAELADTLALLAPPYECEDCIGMKEHGCYCLTMGALQPGGPAPLPAPYDEDDDL